MEEVQVTRSFTYELLEPDHMRLLLLYPGSTQSPLQAGLLSIPFEQAPRYQYQALSYVWGEDKEKRHLLGLTNLSPAEIHFDEYPSGRETREWHITSNLHGAIRQLRDSKIRNYLWIDAICINQDDEQERATQVKKMYTIYSEAAKTIIWLGPKPNKEAFYFVVEVSRYFDGPSEHARGKIENVAESEEYWLQKFVDECYPRFRGCTAPLLARWHDANYIAFLQLISETAWFRRAWVFQECVASKLKIVQQGAFAIPWKLFSNACHIARENLHRQRFSLTQQQALNEFMHRTSTDEDRSFPTLETLSVPQVSRSHSQVFRLVQKMDDARSAMDKPTQKFSKKGRLRPLLRNLLPAIRHMGCEKPRDKVFSLLNVDQEFRKLEGTHGTVVTYERPTSIREQHVFQSVDYKDTTLDKHVCLDVAKYWLASTSGNGSQRLVFLQHVQEKSQTSDWPSWLPDWSAEHRAGILTKRPYDHNLRGTFSASGRSAVAASIKADYKEQSEVPTLRACGVRFKELQIAAIESPHRECPTIRELMAPFREGKYPNASYSYQQAAKKLANYVGDPHPDRWPQSGGRVETDESVILSLERSKAYRDDDGFIRNFFVSRHGYIGFAPFYACEGDEVCILFGAKTPMAIRRQGEHYEFIGECLICGVMDGELMKNLNGNHVENLEFR